jgi:threonine dehydratase
VAASQPPPRVSLADVEAARVLLAGVTRVTPLLDSYALGRSVGAPVGLKCENLQRTGSFKLRGAYVRIAALSAGQHEAGVVAASAGNHAQGVALAASLLGTQATVVMPVGAPLPKVEATRGYGAEVVFSGSTVDEALEHALEIGRRDGKVLVHPFDAAEVLAGQGTVGLEVLDQQPDVATLVVCTGGGGLVAGIAVAVKALRPQVRIVAVQAAGAAAYPASLAAGEPVALSSMSTIADGIAISRPGDLPLAHVAELVDDVLTVDDEALSRAMLLCLERSKLVVEPAGAAAVAALLEEPERVTGGSRGQVVAVLSGGNVDPVLLSTLIRHGMVAAGRYLSVSVRVPDRPGELAALLGVLADAGANVLDVTHARTDAGLHVGEVAVALRMETRGSEHRESVLEHLREAAYPVSGDRR